MLVLSIVVESPLATSEDVELSDMRSVVLALVWVEVEASLVVYVDESTLVPSEVRMVLENTTTVLSDGEITSSEVVKVEDSSELLKRLLSVEEVELSTIVLLDGVAVSVASSVLPVSDDALFAKDKGLDAASVGTVVV